MRLCNGAVSFEQKVRWKQKCLLKGTEQGGRERGTESLGGVGFQSCAKICNTLLASKQVVKRKRRHCSRKMGTKSTGGKTRDKKPKCDSMKKEAMENTPSSKVRDHP